MNRKSMEPYGLALVDYFSGDTSAKIIIRRDDGFEDILPMNFFFRNPSEISALEQRGLDRCRGRILDVGAGVGVHSLMLQNQGFVVCAIDISPEACKIMKKRGVHDVRCVDIFEFKEELFDTILMLNHGIGMVETISGLNTFLKNIRSLVKQDGQVLFDSMDIRNTTDSVHLTYQEANIRAGRYFGEIRTQFEYKGQTGPFFGWLHIDPETLANHALETDWSYEIIYKEECGDYLINLTRL